jgi:magnesium transporter
VGAVAAADADVVDHRGLCGAVAGLIGAVPMISKHFGFDPALTAGPFETALQDVAGVTIFLALATALLGRLA